MKKMILNIKHLCTHLFNIDNRVVKKLFDLIDNIRIYIFFLVIAFVYCLGIFINKRNPFPQYTLFQSLFIGIFIVAFFSVRHYEKQMKDIHRLMSGDNTLHHINDKMYRFRYSTINLIIPPLATAFFGFLAIALVNVNINTPSAVYLIFIYTICVVMSFIGYLQYVYLFVYIKKLSRNTKTIHIYNRDYPSNTKWVILLAKLYGNYRNIFFVLGASYVFGVIYFVLCKDYRVIEKIILNEWQWIYLILFWGSVFLAIVVFFPISSVIEYINIKKIVDNLKNQTVVDLNKMIPLHSKNYEMKIQKSYLVIAVINTPDYPIKDKLGILFSSLVTCINIFASVVAILEYATL